MDSYFNPGGIFLLRRGLIVLVLWAYMLLDGASFPRIRAAEPWFENALVGMEVGPTGAQFVEGKPASEYVSIFDGRDIVRRCAAANAEYLVIWVRDGEFTLHESSILPKPMGLGQRDVLREAVEEGQRIGLPIIVYFQLQYPAFELRRHPEWKIRQADGEPIDYLVCFNSPYRDHVKTILAEVLSYGVDGFHLDMVDQGFGPPTGCWCDHCQELYKNQFGGAMPEGVHWNSRDWDQMLRFRYQTSDRFKKNLTDYIKQMDPDVTVDFNYHGNPPFSWEVGQTPVRHANHGDFVTGEAGLWSFGALTASFNAAWYRAVTPGKPFQVAVQRGVRMYHDQTTRPLNDMRWELFTLLAHGAFVTMIDKVAYHGWLDPVAYERIGELFGEAQAKRSHFGQAPIEEVGIYFSVRTRDWIGRDQAARYFQSVQGAHKTCVYEHHGFGFLFDESITIEKLRNFPMVWLPNAGILTEHEVRLFRQYVMSGGNLLITGQAGQYDSFGQPLKESMLSRLIGAKLTRGLEGKDPWIQFGAEGKPVEIPASTDPPEAQGRATSLISNGIRKNWPFLIEGPASVYEPTGATTVGTLFNSHRIALPNPDAYNKEWPLSANQAVGPGVLINTVGEGKVVTFAGSPDFAVAGEHHVVEARKLLSNAIRFLVPQSRVTVTAPANVEAVVTDDPEQRILRVHLIAYNATPQTTPAKNRPFVLPGLIEDTPLYRATIEFREPIKNAVADDSKTRLEVGRDRVDLLIENIHEVIQCHY